MINTPLFMFIWTVINTALVYFQFGKPITHWICSFFQHLFCFQQFWIFYTLRWRGLQQSHHQLQHALDIALLNKTHIHMCVSTYNKIIISWCYQAVLHSSIFCLYAWLRYLFNWHALRFTKFLFWKDQTKYGTTQLKNHA